MLTCLAPTPIAFLAILAPLALSCSANNRITNNYNNSTLECGQAVNEPYLRVSDGQGKFYSGSEIESFIWSDSSREVTAITPTEKGCITASQLENSSLLLIRKDQNWSKVIPTSDGITETQVILQRSPAARPEQDCGPKYLTSLALDPRSYLSNEGLDVAWLPFYSVSGKLIRTSATETATDIVKSFAKQPLMHWEKWSLADIVEGAYTLQLEVHDYVHGGEARTINCSIDTNQIKLKVRAADKIKSFKRFFNIDYGVVEPGYSVNFYVEGELKNVGIEYCVKKVNPMELMTQNQCSENEIINWLQESDAPILVPGFYYIIHRSFKDEILTDWQATGIMIDKRCVGNYDSISRLNEEECTELIGNLIVDRDRESTLFSLPLLSSISGELRFSDTIAESIQTPNLNVVSKMRLTGNKYLSSLDLPNISQISTSLELNSNPSLINIPSFSSLVFVGGFISISDNENLQTIKGFNKIRTAMSLNITRNKALTEVGGFANLETLDGSLTINANNWLTQFNSLSQLRSISGDVTVSFNPSLESLTGLTGLNQIQGSLMLSSQNISDGLKGLENLKSIGNNLAISYIDNLIDLEPLHALQTINGSLNIGKNSKLELINLPSLKVIGDSLIVSNNPKLTAINDLGSIKSILGTMRIEGNISLAAIDGLCQVTRIFIGDLIFSENHALSSLDCFGELTAIGSSLVISKNSLVNDLSGFSNLKSVGEIIIRENPRLLNLAGLSNLLELASLNIFKNESLQTLDGLVLPENMAGSIELIDNKNLQSIRGLENLVSLSGNLTLSTNPKLSSLNGLEKLLTAEQVDIRDNFALRALNGLDGLSEIAALFIIGNSNLTTLAGISALNIVNGSIYIGNNMSLTTLNGLDGLQSAGKYLHIDRNEKLINIDGLESLRIIEGDLKITDNSALQSLAALSSLHTIGKSILIRGNPILSSSCPHSTEIARSLGDYCQKLAQE